MRLLLGARTPAIRGRVGNPSDELCQRGLRTCSNPCFSVLARFRGCDELELEVSESVASASLALSSEGSESADQDRMSWRRQMLSGCGTGVRSKCRRTRRHNRSGSLRASCIDQFLDSCGYDVKAVIDLGEVFRRVLILYTPFCQLRRVIYIPCTTPIVKLGAYSGK